MTRVWIAAVAATLLLLPSCGSNAKKEEPRAQPAKTESSKARITELYATKPRVTRGEKSMLCYGVENAKSVKLAPAVADVWPAMSRCFEVSPRESTTYTLTAANESGQEVTQTVRVDVGAPGPKILDVNVNRLSVPPGGLVTICYEAHNATDASITPGAFKRPPDPNRGCFSDKPKKTTTYVVKVMGPGGQTDTQKVTVKVGSAGSP
jgi:hypothetical protein